MKGTVHKVKVSVGDNNEELSSMFNQIIGSSGADIGVIYPRYRNLKDTCEKVVGVYTILANTPYMVRTPGMNAVRTSILRTCDTYTTQINSLFNMTLSDTYILDLSQVPQELRDRVIDSYNVAKSSDLIRSMIITCGNLEPHKINFQQMDNLSHTFIINMPGVEWSPFPFTINLKELFVQSECSGNLGTNTIAALLMVLHKTYILTHSIYNLISTPDIDIDKFTSILVDNIDLVQKVPELSRCGEAFKKIKSSVQLLRERFGEYYRDFIQTKQSSVIMEHFILDVSKETDTNAETTRQFREIISYYQKLSRSQPADPRIEKLFAKMSESMSKLDKDAAPLVTIRKTAPAKPPTDGISIAPMGSLENVIANNRSNTNANTNTNINKSTPHSTNTNKSDTGKSDSNAPNISKSNTDISSLKIIDAASYKPATKSSTRNNTNK